MIAPSFEQMTPEQLSAWYVANVGYDLAAEDPAMTLEDFRSTCREVHELQQASQAAEVQTASADRLLPDEASERADFVEWVEAEYGLKASWQPEHNSFSSNLVELAYRAWLKRSTGAVQAPNQSKA